MTEPILDYYGYNTVERYCINGVIHRDPLEGPAYILYNKNGNKFYEQYIENDKVHNPYGPACIDYRYDIYEWFFNSIDYTNEVNEYLDKQGLKWQNMDHIDFAIMWCFIL